MTGLVWTGILSIACATTPGEGAKAEATVGARFKAGESDRPMLVLVTAEWCTACKRLQRQGLSEAKERGVLDQVSFSTVDLDTERELGRELTQGGSIPQLVLLKKTGTGWSRDRLVGNQSADAIKAFLDHALSPLANKDGGNHSHQVEANARSVGAEGGDGNTVRLTRGRRANAAVGRGR